MKTKMMRFFKLLCLCLIFGQLSCEKDFDENKPQNQNEIKVKEYTFDQINQKPKFNNSYSVVTGGILNKLSTSRDNESNPINFSIDSTTIKEITSGNKTTYTMSVVRDIQQTESFENFIVEVNNTTNNIRAFLIEYFPETEIEHEHEHNSFNFHGTKKIREIEYDSSIFQPLVDSYECTATLMCDYGGAEHIAGGNCGQTYLVIDCNTGGGGGSGGSGSGSGNTGSGSGDTGSGGSGSGSGNTGSGGSGYGGGGGGSSGSGSNNTNPPSDPIVTAPVLTEEYLDAQAQIKREKDFKRNLNWEQSTWLNANTDTQNSIFEYLETQVTNSNNETYPQEAVEFIKWGINHFINNPSVTWQQFKNWFMGESEGRDFEYDEQYWENPNLTFPQQNLPTYNTFFNAYPKNQDGSWMVGTDNVYGYVGGQVQQARINYPNDTNNTCALKVSIALNGAGISIPYISGQTIQGGGQFANQYFFLNARALNKWMRKTFGTTSNPNYMTIPASQITQNGENLPSLLANVKGIYSLVCPLGSTWASGHADIIDNTLCAANCHFYDAPIEYIDVWKLN